MRQMIPDNLDVSSGNALWAQSSSSTLKLQLRKQPALEAESLFLSHPT